MNDNADAARRAHWQSVYDRAQDLWNLTGGSGSGARLLVATMVHALAEIREIDRAGRRKLLHALVSIEASPRASRIGALV